MLPHIQAPACALQSRGDPAQCVVATALPWCAGDVWDVQPAPKDHPWRTMKNHGMTAHVAGNTLDAQARYQQACARA